MQHHVAVATHPCLHSGPGMSQQFPAASAPSPLSSECATCWPGSTSSLSPRTDGNQGHSTARRTKQRENYSDHVKGFREIFAIYELLLLSKIQKLNS